MSTHAVDARYSTNNQVGRDQINIYYAFPPVESAYSSSKPLPSLSFNDAPVDLLSVHFTGREKELAYIGKVLDEAQGDVPTRCVIHGMHGIGKTQLALRFAKTAFDRQLFSLIFWITATTVEKLHQGFSHLLDLIDHPYRALPQQSSRLTAARRWLEESSSVDWLVVLDDVDRETLGFLREHLPRKNSRGSILVTTRTEGVAKAIASVGGQQHTVFELQLPDAKDAARLLLGHLANDGLGIDAFLATPSTASKAEEVVGCVGFLPLAVAQASSFMAETHKSLDDLLNLYQSDHKIDVSS
jgi:hypothetical protein